MQFTVPKFLERETKIAFGLTFKNLAVLAGIGFVLFVLYYALPKTLFAFIAIVLGGAFLASTFIKIGGQSLPQLVFHGFRFLSGARTYVWNKPQTTSPVRLVKKPAPPPEKKAEALKIAPQSKLSYLGSRIVFPALLKQNQTNLPSRDQEPSPPEPYFPSEPPENNADNFKF